MMGARRRPDAGACKRSRASGSARSRRAAQLRRGRVQALDEDDLRLAARARAAARVLAQTRARLVLKLARRHDDDVRRVRLRLAVERTSRVCGCEVAVAQDEEERLAANV